MEKFKIIIEKLKYVTLMTLMMGWLLKRVGADFVFSGDEYLTVGFLFVYIYCFAKLFGKLNMIEKLKYVGLIIFSTGFFLDVTQGSFIFSGAEWIVSGWLVIFIYFIAKLFGK